MSKFTDKVKAFLKDVEADAVGAEQHVVAWFHNIFASHTAGNTPAPPTQAGATPPPVVPTPAPPVANAPVVNPNPPAATPPAVHDPAAPVQAGSAVPTPNPAPVSPPNVPTAPGAQPIAAPVTELGSDAVALKGDADGYVSVDQLPGVTQPVVLKYGKVMTALVLGQYDPKSDVYFKIKANTALTTRAIASAAAVEGTISNHNTAYGVTGTYPNFSLNGQPDNDSNTCTPDTLAGAPALVAYLNALDLGTEQHPIPASTAAPGSGDYEKKMQERREGKTP